MSSFRLATYLATIIVASASIAAEDPVPDHSAGSLAKDEAQAVYAAEPTDAWSRIFYCLFTRTVRTRLSDDFPEGKPFERIRVAGFPELPVSNRSFERIESGDRAIEPLYPSSPGYTTDRDGANRAMVEPLYSQLKKALEDALHEQNQRPPLARALMQADVWAAHDILSRNYNFEGEAGKQRLERRNQLLKLLRRIVKKLALTEDEIKSLPDNYAAGVRVAHLPDLFGDSSEWMEIRWYEGRIHDFAADYRRAARVFVKPASPPKDRGKFLNGLRQARNFPEQLDAVALVTQNLLIDSNGKVVPTPLTYEVQMRIFVKDRKGKLVKTEAKQFELNRKLFLNDLKSGGLVALDAKSPVYLSDAGNDYSFASADHEQPVSEPILVRLGTRCIACHGTAGVMTFAHHADPSVPTVRFLKPSANDHARYVVGRKVDREDFKALQKLWKKE